MKTQRKTIYKLVCAECGCTFVALNKRAKFHAPVCRLKAWRRTHQAEQAAERYAVDSKGEVYRVYPVGTDTE